MLPLRCSVAGLRVNCTASGDPVLISARGHRVQACVSTTGCTLPSSVMCALASVHSTSFWAAALPCCRLHCRQARRGCTDRAGRLRAGPPPHPRQRRGARWVLMRAYRLRAARSKGLLSQCKAPAVTVHWEGPQDGWIEPDRPPVERSLEISCPFEHHPALPPAPGGPILLCRLCGHPAGGGPHHGQLRQAASGCARMQAGGHGARVGCMQAGGHGARGACMQAGGHGTRAGCMQACPCWCACLRE